MQRNRAVQDRARQVLAVFGVCAAVCAFPAALAEPAASASSAAASTSTSADREAALRHCGSGACVVQCGGLEVVVDDGDEVEYVRVPGRGCVDPVAPTDPARPAADPTVSPAVSMSVSPAVAPAPADPADPVRTPADPPLLAAPTPPPAHSGILFPEPSKGPPRQFPLHSPTPTPKPTPPVVAPSKPAPSTPAPAVVRAAPAPQPAVVTPKPTPTPKPKPKPTPTPTQPPVAVIQTTFHTVPHHRLSTVLVVFVVAIVPVSLARARR